MRNQWIKKAVVLLTVAAVGFGVTGCGGQASDSTQATKAVPNKTIAFIPPTMVSAFYEQTITGAKQKAKELGYEVSVTAPQKEDDYEGLLKNVEDAITKKVAAIAICTTDDKTMAIAVQKANAAKIPVIVFNSQDEVQGTTVYSYVGYNQKKAGESVAEYLGTKYKDRQCNVAILEGLPGVFTANRGGGFEEAAKNYSNIKIVAKQAANWEREKGMNAATNMYQANNVINVFYGLSDEMALGAAQAAKSLGLKDIITIGIDGNPNTLSDIKAGICTASVYTNPFKIGEETIVDCDKAIKGEKLENIMHEIKTLIVDKDNVDQYLK
ncbi:ribose transport system substrate-binding protein [Sporomusaceae bacterium BoRhaA]|uniref:sugar ABC transporter substrate-binding protein n=1 Tax=Pelorhabdus rhamnosifermentans TaxID=2772457 RepID=UPI001C062AE6|nr:sugar ABC transporter substrate-binding protein [Pelorhabdus rhamnosifermentans]MBU2702744.1 ribose transport system substrate-binding protein [Pelorhabdus rhamnosifermentans]